MSKKVLYCTLDTETVGGSTGDCNIYNLGCVIHDKAGNIFATTSILVMEYYDEIKNEKHYGKKNFPLYEQRLKRGEMTAVATETEAVELVRNLCKFYGVKYVTAYNSGFDFEKTSCHALLDDFEFIDIWYGFFETIGKYAKYNKFCCEHGYITSSNNLQMTAEVAYRFCSNNNDFIEEHTALSDAMIEKEILISVLNTHRKYPRNVHKGDSMHRFKVVKAKTKK